MEECAGLFWCKGCDGWLVGAGNLDKCCHIVWDAAAFDSLIQSITEDRSNIPDGAWCESHTAESAEHNLDLLRREFCQLEFAYRWRNVAPHDLSVGFPRIVTITDLQLGSTLNSVAHVGTIVKQMFACCPSCTPQPLLRQAPAMLVYRSHYSGSVECRRWLEIHAWIPASGMRRAVPQRIYGSSPLFIIS
jgi:hypothetical protein